MAKATLDSSAKHRTNMNPFRLTLRPAALADIDVMMAIERSPDYELYVARSEEEEHRAMLSSPSHAYRLGVGRIRRGRGLRHPARASATRTPTYTSSASPSPAPGKAWARRF